MHGGGAAVSIEQEDGTVGAEVGVDFRGVVVYVRLRSERRCTFTSPLNLPAAEQGVVEKIRQAAIKVHGGQAALEALSGSHQLWQAAIHAGTESCNEQIP